MAHSRTDHASNRSHVGGFIGRGGLWGGGEREEEEKGAVGCGMSLFSGP